MAFPLVCLQFLKHVPGEEGAGAIALAFLFGPSVFGFAFGLMLLIQVVQFLAPLADSL
jgi:hypothetical protein